MTGKFDKSVAQLERMVQNIRITCQQMLLKGRRLKGGDTQEYSNSQSVSSDEAAEEDNEAAAQADQMPGDTPAK